jgi:hypothetical protein
MTHAPCPLAAIFALCLFVSSAAAQQAAEGAQAQPVPAENAPTPKTTARSRAFRPAPAENPFALSVVPWFSLAPQGSALIRPGPQGSIDLAAREDETYITVAGKKKIVDPRPSTEHDYSAASWSDIAMPKEIPIGPPGSCAGGAYRTIGGQSANGADLMGGLGGGRC